MSKRRTLTPAEIEELVNEVEKMTTGSTRLLTTSPENIPTEALEEWDLDNHPVPLPDPCDLCGGDATDGQSSEHGRFCVSCLGGR